MPVETWQKDARSADEAVALLESVVTEYGAVNLQGLTLRERGAALVGIAHPDFRNELQREFTRIRRC